MRIVQVVKTNRGAAWAFHQAKWLWENGVEIITVMPSDTEGYAEKYRQCGMPLIKGDWSLPLTRPWRFFSIAGEIRRAIAELKPDLIHMHFVTNVYMMRLALRKSATPRLFQVPGPLHLEGRLFNYLDRRTANRYDYWAGACRKTCSIYRREGIDESRVFLAYYGSPVNKLQAGERVSATLRAQYGIREDEIVVAMVSYFYKPKKYLGQKRGLKGHEDFIDAVEIAVRKNPKIRPMIIGNAWDGAEAYESDVRRYAREKLGDRIIFTGFRDDVPQIYPEIDIAVHPSHSENLGGAAESLALCVPTIATDIGGFPDIVKDHQTGLLVPMKAPQALADAILQMAGDMENARSMAAEGKKLVNGMLAIETTSGRIKDIYETILSQNESSVSKA